MSATRSQSQLLVPDARYDDCRSRSTRRDRDPRVDRSKGFEPLLDLDDADGAGVRGERIRRRVPLRRRLRMQFCAERTEVGALDGDGVRFGRVDADDEDQPSLGRGFDERRVGGVGGAELLRSGRISLSIEVHKVHSKRPSTATLRYRLRAS